jgi:hypothetical protein
VWESTTPLQSCQAIQHGTEYTEIHERAVAEAHLALGGRIDQVDIPMLNAP